MKSEIGGKYQYPGSSRSSEAKMVFTQGEFRVLDEEGNQLAGARSREVRVSSRLGSVPRMVRFPDHSCFETPDNDGLDEWLKASGRGSGILSVLEGKLRYALVLGLATILLLWAFVAYGIPSLAKVAAHQLPRDFLDEASDFTLETLDDLVLEPSQLEEDRRKEIRSLVDATFPWKADSDYQLLFRRGGEDLGANAFALPNGVIVFTDELVGLLESDEEILAVFAHEYGHVVERHSLRQLLQDSAVTVLSFLIIGEATDTLQEALNALPTIFLHGAYSREFETHADDYAFRMLSEAGLSPKSFGDALRRLEEEHGMGEDMQYFSTHPPTEERIRRANEAERLP